MSNGTAVQGTGTVTLRYFRIANRDQLVWDGTNVDATPTGFQLFDVPRPREIDVVRPDEQTQSGFILLRHFNDFKLILRQESKVETGVDLVSRLLRIPGATASGGATEVARAIADLVNQLIGRIRVSITGVATTTLSRTEQDGGGTIVVLAVGETRIRGEVDPAELGGISFTVTTDATGGVDGPKDDTKTFSTPGTFNFQIFDSVYVRMPPKGDVPVGISVTLEGNMDPVVSQQGLNELIEKIKQQLRAVGSLQGSGADERLNTPQPQPNEPNQSYIQRIGDFGAQLLSAFQAVLNLLLDSIKRRILGVLVTQTTWKFQIRENIPDDVRQRLELAAAPAGLEQETPTVIVRTQPGETASQPYREVKVIENLPLSAETAKLLSNVLAPLPFKE